MSFLNSIQSQSKKHEFPFDHWEYNNALSDGAIEEIIKADIPDVSKHNLNYDGTRAIDGGAAEFREGIASGGEAIKFRCFVTKENEKQFPNLVKFINELQSKETHEAISKMINKDLSNSYVRVEVICDREGFWLKPHCDIKEKLLSGLIFVNNANESEELGTDFYNEKLEKVKTVPYKNNYGYLFSSGPNTWHGMEKKKIVKERRCLQVNYVTFPTDWKVAQSNFCIELAKVLDIKIKQNSPSLVETYLAGKEYSVGIFDKLSKLAKDSFKALGGKSLGRIDIKMDHFGIPHFIEANLMPGLRTGYFYRSCVLNLDMSYEDMIFSIANTGLSSR